MDSSRFDRAKWLQLVPAAREEDESGVDDGPALHALQKALDDHAARSDRTIREGNARILEQARAVYKALGRRVTRVATALLFFVLGFGSAGVALWNDFDLLQQHVRAYAQQDLKNRQLISDMKEDADALLHRLQMLEARRASESLWTASASETMGEASHARPSESPNRHWLLTILDEVARYFGLRTPRIDRSVHMIEQDLEVPSRDALVEQSDVELIKTIPHEVTGRPPEEGAKRIEKILRRFRKGF